MISILCAHHVILHCYHWRWKWSDLYIMWHMLISCQWFPPPKYYIFPLFPPYFYKYKSHSSLNYCILKWHAMLTLMWPSVVATTFNGTNGLMMSWVVQTVRACGCCCVMYGWVFLFCEELNELCQVTCLSITHSLFHSSLLCVLFLCHIKHAELSQPCLCLITFISTFFRQFHPDSIEMIVYFPCVCLFYIQEGVCDLFFKTVQS